MHIVSCQIISHKACPRTVLANLFISVLEQSLQSNISSEFGYSQPANFPGHFAHLAVCVFYSFPAAAGCSHVREVLGHLETQTLFSLTPVK